MSNFHTSTEGAACLATLQWLNPEKALLLSMLGDAALELHRVVRAFDTDVCDESELPYELDRYRAVIRKLFVEGNCLHVGLTKIMLKHLSEPRLLMCQGVRVKLGGADEVTEQLKRQCLKRMSAYVVVAESVLEGEFPHFQLVSSLRVFSLSDEGRLQTQLRSGERANCLEKLARAIGVDVESLKYEFEHFLPIASKFARVEGLENFPAWKKAIQSTQKSRMVHPAEALIPALARLACWSCSSSGVERGFATAQSTKQMGQSQDDNTNLEEVMLVLQQDVLGPDFGEAAEKNLIAGAKKTLDHPLQPSEGERSSETRCALGQIYSQDWGLF